MSEEQAEYQGVKHKVFYCDKCSSGEAFYTINSLQEHVSSKHATPEKFIAKVGERNGASK